MHSAHRRLPWLVTLWAFSSFHPGLLFAEPSEDRPAAEFRLLRPWSQGGNRIEPGPAKQEWQRLRLLALSKRLDRDLADFDSASHWQTFLHMPREVMFLKNSERTDLIADSLAASLERFSLVAEETKYRKIASLSSFQILHLALRAYAGLDTRTDPQPQKSAGGERSFAWNKKTPVPVTSANRRAAIERLPPVLISGEQPKLLTPPDQLPLR